MTEAEWLACDDPALLLAHLRRKVSERKLRLFAVACCRRVGHLFMDRRCRDVVEVAERYAEGLASDQDLAGALALAEAARRAAESASVAAHGEALSARGSAEANRSLDGQPLADRYWGAYLADATAKAAYAAAYPDAGKAAEGAAYAGAYAPAFHAGVFECPDSAAEKAAQAGLLRCVAGNPFRRPPPARRVWLAWEGAVPRLAEAVYEERTFERLPILADALEEAGCANPDVLNHCRQPGAHVRGCWVIDLLLGKA